MEKGGVREAAKGEWIGKRGGSGRWKELEEGKKWKRGGSGRGEEVEEGRKWKRGGSGRGKEVEEGRKWKSWR